VSLAITSVSCPLLLVQLAVVGSTVGTLEFQIGSVELSAVTVPVSPVRVTAGLPAAAPTADLQLDKSGTLDCSCTVMVLAEQGQGVLWDTVKLIQLSAEMYNGPL